MVENALKRVKANLLQKSEILDKLHSLYDKQSALLESVDMEKEVFDGWMDEQDGLLQELIILNEESDDLYESLRLEKFSVDGPYADQIDSLKILIAQIMDKTNSLQKKEQINKQKLNAYFENERKNLGSGRRSSKAALDYFKNMNRSNVISPQFMDRKK